MGKEGVYISVVSAVFNAAEFITDCLRSVREQVATDVTIEHIVVDGASTDGTGDILRQWADGEGKTMQGYSERFISEPDKGQSDAFNKGVAMAKGEWICWLNADDLLAPRAIRAFENALQKNPEADVIYGHVQFINEDSSPAWISYQIPYFYPLNMWGCYAPPSVGTFFRRDLLLQEPLGINYHYVMDVEWFLRCGRNLNTICVDQVFSHFRISANAKTSEMIRSGKITERHALERESYRRRHVYSQWPWLSEEQARRKFKRRQRLFLWLYKAMKMRYALRYLAARRG